MAPREIIAIPDKRLRLKSEPVVKIDDSICALAEEMFEAMYAAPGIGLAAIQVDVPKQVIVVELPRPAVDGQGDELLLDEADDRLGPVGGRTAPGAGASADADGRAAGAAPGQNRLALRGRLRPRLPHVDLPGDLVEEQLALYGAELTPAWRRTK